MAELNGFGKIYETTWWGVGINNLIGWGSIYKDLVVNLALDFNNRVINDGGTYEANTCLVNYINTIT